MMEEEAVGPFSHYQTIWRFTQLLDRGVGNCEVYKSQIQLINIANILTPVSFQNRFILYQGKNEEDKKKIEQKKFIYNQLEYPISVDEVNMVKFVCILTCSRSNDSAMV